MADPYRGPLFKAPTPHPPHAHKHAHSHSVTYSDLEGVDDEQLSAKDHFFQGEFYNME